MDKLNQDELQVFISEKVIRPFYEKRIEGLNKLALNSVMKRKNPYLFKAKNIQTAEELVRYILDAFLSSQEETIFGNLMEELAIYVNQVVFKGYKAEQGRFKSVDLIFVREGKTYIVGIKSGPHWGNRDQIDRMKGNFVEAKKLLRSEGDNGEMVAVNGCIYGKDSRPYKIDTLNKERSYYKLCGQDFWELITGDPEFYQRIVVPIDKEAKKRDEFFRETYYAKVNQLTKDFSDDYLSEDGQIDWKKIIDCVSKRSLTAA